MGRALRWLGFAAAGLLGLAVLASVGVWLASARILGSAPAARPEHLARPTAAQVADAPRQLSTLACRDCHGADLRGGPVLDDPKVARIRGPNLTLIAAQATDQQLAAAIRQGIGRDGRPLLAMPSSGFSQLTDQEVAAIIGAVRAMPRGGSEQPAVSVGPLGRLGLLMGQLTTAPASVAAQQAHLPLDLGPQYARGRHIVVSICADCHGPDLTGGEPVPGTKAPDLSIAGAYDLAQFTRLLREGVAPGKTLTLMGDTARRDFKYFHDDEIAAIHAYLYARATH